jgi:hypothetical protein
MPIVKIRKGKELGSSAREGRTMVGEIVSEIDGLIRPVCTSVTNLLLFVGVVMVVCGLSTLAMVQSAPFQPRDPLLYAAMWAEGAWFAWRPIRCYRENSRAARLFGNIK